MIALTKLKKAAIKNTGFILLMKVFILFQPYGTLAETTREITITPEVILGNDTKILITRCVRDEYFQECRNLWKHLAEKENFTEEEREFLIEFSKNNLLLFDNPKGLKSRFKVERTSDPDTDGKFLIYTTEDKLHLLFSTTQRHPETPDWIDFYPLDLEGSRWLMFARITDPLDSPQCAFRFELTDDVYGVYRILEDNTLSRIGEDADAVFDDLVALKDAHAAGTLKDAPPALKTDFAKAVLARLLEQAARPEQSSSEHSEVGRQAAE